MTANIAVVRPTATGAMRRPATRARRAAVAAEVAAKTVIPAPPPQRSVIVIESITPGSAGGSPSGIARTASIPLTIRPNTA